MRYRAIVAYDGTAYQGFQRLTRRSQDAEGSADGNVSANGGADNATIQGVLEATISRVAGGTPIAVIGAGRTDTGVHATGQVIAFDLDWRHQEADLIRAINATLPTDIALQTLEPAEPDFHPRYDATSRSYTYLVYEAQVRQPIGAWYSWWVRPRAGELLDLQAMQKASEQLIGEHDFASFGAAPQGENTVRRLFRSKWDVESAWTRKRLLVYDIEATAFLYHMVRTIVGTLIEVGLKRITTADFVDILQAKDRSRAYRIAPPHGLTLTEVRYNGRERRPPEK